MNILMVIDDFLPDIMRGSGRAINELSKSLLKRDHKVYILTRTEKSRKLPLRENIEGLEIYRYNSNPKNIITFCFSSLLNAKDVFNQISEKISLDLINFHQPLSALGVNLSRNTKRIPKVYTFFSPWHKEYEIKTGKSGINSLARKWLERKMLTECKRIIVLSEYSKKEVLSIHKIATTDIEIIPGGVDTTKFKPINDKKSLRAKLSISSNKSVIFTIRNLTPRMGLENLIEAMANIIKVTSDIVLIIGGKGVLEDKLKTLVNRLELNEYVKFAGFIEEGTLPLYYQAADLFILPTKCLEGFGLVTLEALASGVPVLGTPVGGTKEILGQLDRDLLFNDITAKSMTEKILAYLSSKDLFELGKRCRNFVISNYSWDRMATEYERIYLQVLDKNEI